MYLTVTHRKWVEFDKSGHIGWRCELHTHTHTHPLAHTQTSSSWGPLLLQRPVKLGVCGISIVHFVFWRDPSEVIVACVPSFPLHASVWWRCVDMMYEAVCRGWAEKNGALHHLASHCQTQPRHYTSQKYQAHPRSSNFAICWQCLHGGWFVITNSGAKINKLIYDPSCICTMKMPLVM